MALAIKFAALWLIWWVWFSAPQDETLDGPKIGQAIYSVNPAERNPHAP